MTSEALDLVFAGPDWRQLQDHLFPGDRDEHGAVILCGRSHDGRKLLVRDVIPAADGSDYIPGNRGYRQLTGTFVTRQLRRARDEGLVYLAVHNHGGRDHVDFSPSDLASHERGYPTLLALAKQPVGGLVLARRAVAGDIWLPSGQRALIRRTELRGRSREVLGAAAESVPATQPRFDRQSLLYGDAGQAVLGASKVGIVGCGGVGMILVELLAKLGVGGLVVIEPERVDVTNLPRLPGATNIDAMTWLTEGERPAWVRGLAARLAAPKLRVARRLARRASRGLRFEGIAGDVADDSVARKLLDCDFLFLAADSMRARLVVNQIAYQYLIPSLQVGSKVTLAKESGSVQDAFSVVRTLGVRRGCMLCNGLIDPAQLQEESVGDARQVARQRYVDDEAVRAPSVITLNAIGAAWAAEDFMRYMTGLGSPESGFRLIRVEPVREGRHVTLIQPKADANCHVCGTRRGSARALGDGSELPTRMR